MRTASFPFHYNIYSKKLALRRKKVYYNYMYKILRIICCVIAALFLVACVFVFVYLGVMWGLCTVVGAAAFFALTILFKSLQEDYEKKNKPAPDNQPEEKDETK